MGTNFYRIITDKEVRLKRSILLDDINNMDTSPASIERRFEVPIEGMWSWESPWDKFVSNTRIHLGKRSGGWKFTWNFHDNKYYSNKEELLSFIRCGRVVDEYGEEKDIEEFIEMTLNWCQPDGAVYNKEYTDKMRAENKNYYPFPDDTSYYSRIIDGLVVSSSTDFS